MTGAPVVNEPLPPDARILLIRLDELGDVVLTTPVIRALRRACPAGTIWAVVKPALTPLLEACPYVDRVVGFDPAAPRWKRPFVLPWRAWGTARRELARLRPHVAVLPRWDVDSHFAILLARWSGANRIVAHSSRVTRRKALLNPGFDALATDVVPPGPRQHLVQHHLDVLAQLGVERGDARLEVWSTDRDRARARQMLAEHPAGDVGPLVALAPTGGNSPLKQWPPERFAELAQRLSRRRGPRVIVLGGPGEESLTRQVVGAARDRVLDLGGRTSLGELVAVLEQCRLFVGNDAGPLHIAAALQLSTVALFGASDVDRFAPHGPGHRTLWHAMECSPRHRPDRPDRCPTCRFDEPRCLTGIGVAEVEVAAVELLSQSDSEGRGRIAIP